MVIDCVDLEQSHAIYVVAELKCLRRSSGESYRVLFRVPTEEKRLISVDDSGKKFVCLEDVISANIQNLGTGMEVIEAFPIRITRNTKLELEEATHTDERYGIDLIMDECPRRQTAPVTRLEITPKANVKFVQELTKVLGLDDLDVYKVDSDTLDLASCFSLCGAPEPGLRHDLKEPVIPAALEGISERIDSKPGMIFNKIRKENVLVEYPRKSFDNSTVLFLQAAARDKHVKSIHAILYLSGSDSPIVKALKQGSKLGKQVFVLVELKAGFDEMLNTEIARHLMDGGCNIIYGVPGKKVHSKVVLIVREEGDKLLYYSNVSTGNYNAKTAKLYTDMSLFTCWQEVGRDIKTIFTRIHLHPIAQKLDFDDLQTLLVASGALKKRFIELIRREAKFAQVGKGGRVIAQINGLTDKEIVEELYEASQEGVKIDLIVRGICRLHPEIPQKSENIKVFSWIGAVLQHRCIVYFGNGKEGKFFIGSADWRTRNLNDRIEVVVPICRENRKIVKRLTKAFNIVRQEGNIWRMSWDGRYYQGLPAKVDINSSPTVSDKAEDSKPNQSVINLQGENIVGQHR